MNSGPVIMLLAFTSPSVTGQINDRIETAMLFGIIASAAAITAVTLFFVFHIPRCIDALTGLGKRRELAKLKKKKTHTVCRNSGAANTPNAARKYIISSDDSYRDRPLPEGFIIEQELPFK
ncbi:MAG: hypothetical protein K6C95_03280 [Lachnospiraceae bacterium]|nr:hypothetical protein [Lachnospiraceae bacterium]